MPQVPGVNASTSDKLLAVASYFGVGPVLGFCRRRVGSPFVRHHHGQASVLCLLFFACLALQAVVLGYLEWSSVSGYRGTAEFPLSQGLANVLARWTIVCWLAIWSFCVGCAGLGVTPDVPLVMRLARKHVLVSCASLLTCLGWAAFLVAASMAAYGLRTTSAQLVPAKAYVLYDDMERYPRWMFCLGFFPIVRAAQDKWPRGNVVVAPLSEHALAYSLRHGSFLFVASHGDSDGLLLDDRHITPRDLAAAHIRSNLEFVYLTACESGVLASEWQKVFAPARVITFSAPVSKLRHLYWIWVQGPDEILGRGMLGRTHQALC